LTFFYISNLFFRLFFHCLQNEAFPLPFSLQAFSLPVFSLQVFSLQIFSLRVFSLQVLASQPFYLLVSPPSSLLSSQVLDSLPFSPLAFQPFFLLFSPPSSLLVSQVELLQPSSLLVFFSSGFDFNTAAAPSFFAISSFIFDSSFFTSALISLIASA